jgi:protein-L-isoaspartate(D-aspartate) O-methyltransferase
VTNAATASSLFNERVEERTRLVNHQLRREGIVEPRVLAAMSRVPRHRFVPDDFQDEAYQDRPLSIGWGQTISQPFVVALMTETARITPTDRCLEIGTGSGYQAAILAELCADTYSVEYLAPLAQFAKANLTNLGYKVHLRTGDGYRGWPEAAPFNVILVTAAPDSVPQPLLEQLALKGRLVIPVGEEHRVQTLELWVRQREGRGRDSFERRELADVRFVPFLGPGGKD